MIIPGQTRQNYEGDNNADAGADADADADAEADADADGHLIQLRRKTTSALCGAVIRRA